MIGFLEPIMALIDLGATGALMVMVWKFMVKRTKKNDDSVEEMNQERRELYNAQTDLVKEVTTALVDKNHTDDKMSEAVIKLSDELNNIRGKLKGQTDETSS